MNLKMPTESGAATLADVTNRRCDLLRRDIVDRAIAVQQRSNTICAVEYLKSQNISSHVIERVLLEPQQRRHTSRR